MAEQPAQQFTRVAGHVLRETLWRGVRVCLFVRPLVNLWLMLRTRSLIHPLARIDWNVHIGRRCFIGRATLDTLGGNGRIEIGDGSIIYTGAELLCHHRSTIRIGRNVLFTRQAGAVTGGHMFDDPNATILSQGIRTADITVGDDCWIGYRAVLLPGAKIGSGTVVAAGAVVVGELPEKVVAGGVPARVLRRRGEGKVR
jgi:acetyltransferase-like isoleucine patch superfamily enzyme